MKTTQHTLVLLSALALAACQAHAGVEPEGDVSTEYLRNTCAEGTTVRGIDVSKWQDSIDWDRVAGSGVRFAFIRVSDGSRVIDERFTRNWSEARRVGILRGVYQFFRPAQDVATQANIVIDAIRADGGELAPVIDVEDAGGRSPSQVAAAVQQWISLVSAATGRTPIVYTGPYFWRDQVGNADQSASPLWIAHYTTGCPLISEDRWPRWTFWQYTDRGRVPGISGGVDMNYFNGTMDQLLAMASGGGTPAPVPPTPPAASGSGELAWPTDEHRVTSYVSHTSRSGLVRYDCDGISRSNHKGTDIGVPRGTSVRAALAGRVIRAVDGCSEGSSSCGGGFGNHVILQHADGRATLYGHMTNGSIRVRSGEVDCGTELGLSGNTGHSTGPHLHFEVRDGVTGIGNYYDRTPTDPFGGSCSTQSDDLWGDSCTPVSPRDDSRYMSSTYPRTITVSPGDTVTQSWRLENTGSTTWTSGEGYQLVHTSGPTMNGLSRVGVTEAIATHANTRFEVTFEAPATPGTYAVSYRMQHGDALFGQTVSLSIRVAGPASCHSATLGEDVASGSCVQVTYAGCGMSRCAWFACSNGSWFCTDPGTCTGDERHANAACEPETPPTGGPTGGSCGAGSLYGGITQDGSEIPRSGLANPTLRSALGVSTEPYGTVTTYQGNPWVSGTVSWFGGPSDTGVTATETGAVSGEVLRSLASPRHPDAATLAARPDDYYFIAMRFNYAPNSTGWWRNARLIVTNPSTGAQVVVRPVDWGPNTSTGRSMDLSEQALTDLGLGTDATALVAFAPPGTALGPVVAGCGGCGSCGECAMAEGCTYCPGDGQCYADADAGMCDGETTNDVASCDVCHDIGGTCATRDECCGASDSSDIQCVQGFCEDVTMCGMNGDSCIDADPMARCCGIAMCGRDASGTYECCFAPGMACTSTSECCGDETCEGGHCQARQIGESCQNTQECEGSSYCLDDHTCGY